MTWFLIGIAGGILLARIRSARADARLAKVLERRIVNFEPPTTAQVGDRRRGITRVRFMPDGMDHPTEAERSTAKDIRDLYAQIDEDYFQWAQAYLRERDDDQAG